VCADANSRVNNHKKNSPGNYLFTDLTNTDQKRFMSK